MSKRTIPVLLALAVLLAACGPQATPTMDPAEVQGTAVAAAWTMVAATQAALPTATPVPPTNTAMPTPLPTFTQQVSALPSLLPTIAGAFPTPTQPPAANDPNNCLMPLDMGEAGPTTPVRIENESGGTIYSISLNLYEKNAFGQCGAISLTNIPKNGKEIVQLPKGKWFAYAWINYRGGTSSTSSGSFELRVGDDLIRLVVRQDVIAAKGP